MAAPVRGMSVAGYAPMKKLVNPRSPLTLTLADVARLLPPRWLPGISACVGEALYWLRGKRRRDVLKRYRRLMELTGQAHDPALLTRRFFRRQFLLMTSSYVFQDAASAAWRDGLVRIEGLEPVREALDSGRGVLVATMHFGTNQLSFAHLEHLGYKVAAMRPASMAAVRSPRERRMLFIHNNPVFVGGDSGLASSVRLAVRVLKEGHILGVAMDGDQGGGLTGLPLLGGTYPLRVGGLEIARLAKAPLAFALGSYTDGRYTVRFSPLLEPGDEDPAVVADRFLRICMDTFEASIREFPDCVWFTRPMDCALGFAAQPTTDEAVEGD